MERNVGNLRWFKSSASAAGNCVEVAHMPGGGVAVRDSKDRVKAPHVYTSGEWEAFLLGAKNGEFDLPLAYPTKGRRRAPAARGSPPFSYSTVRTRHRSYSSAGLTHQLRSSPAAG